MRQNNLLEVAKITKNIYDYGCYFMSILYAVRGDQTLNDLITYYNTFLMYDWIDEECTILNPVEIMKYLTGGIKYNVAKVSEYDDKADIKIAYWYNPNTGLHHFVLMKNSTDVLYDPFENSRTVKEGYIESWRLYYRLNK